MLGLMLYPPYFISRFFCIRPWIALPFDSVRGCGISISIWLCALLIGSGGNFRIFVTVAIVHAKHACPSLLSRTVLQAVSIHREHWFYLSRSSLALSRPSILSFRTRRYLSFRILSFHSTSFPFFPYSAWLNSGWVDLSFPTCIWCTACFLSLLCML
jgi:hypothetical protein